MASFRQHEEEENAAELQFGKEFNDDGDFLMNDEALVFLEKLKGQLDAEGKHVNETFEQTLNYMRKVTAVKIDTESLFANTSELRKALTTLELTRKIDGGVDKLHKYEVASLANLIPQESSVEEAVAWIPSMSRFDESQVQEILDKICKIKSRLPAGF